MTADPPLLEGVSYFDGRSAEARRVTLRLDGPVLVVSGPDVERRVPVDAIQWPERTRHGARTAHFSDGGSLEAADAAAWDRWLAASGRDEPVLVRVQQSWRGVLASTLALAALLVAVWIWGVPWAARVGVAAVPQSVDAAFGERALEALDRRLLRPSELSAADQARIRDAFEHAVGAMKEGSVPPHRLVFRSSRIGPNAFALPGGTMVMTDELVALVDGDLPVLTGVLGHELGHLRHRHGMRMLAQAAAIGVIAGLVVGDFSSLLATVPVLLGEASYSRDAEREADAEAVRVLRAARISPLVMVTFFERVAAWRARGSAASGASAPSARTPDDDDAGGLGIAIASHPADAERIRFFREAAAR